MKTHVFTLTATTERDLTAGAVRTALDELITDGQSVAQGVTDNPDASGHARADADDALSLDIAIVPGYPDVLQLLRDERDAWFQSCRTLADQIEQARNAGNDKLKGALQVALAHANNAYSAADDLLLAAAQQLERP